MPFFDFHVHVALKPQFADVAKRDSPWTKFAIGFSILDSQSSASNLIEGQVNLVGLVLHAPEQNMALELHRFLTRNDLLVKVVKFFTSKVFGRILTKVAMERIVSIGTGKVYYDLITEELDNIETHTTSPDGKYKLKILQKKEEYQELDTNTIYCFLVVEGVHCFFGSEPVTTPAGEKQFFKNMTSFFDKRRVFAVNIAHLQQNNICNHSFGIKIFDNRLFYPLGSGLNQPIAGKVIDEIYTRNILVDIKHMSVKARDEFYELRRAKGYTKLPIICTHAGVTGVPRSQAFHYVKRCKWREEEKVFELEHMKRLGVLPRTSFNLSSINLYDDDIAEILKGGGLIGISFDRRIIGYTESYDPFDIFDLEFMSQPEKEHLLGTRKSFPQDRPDDYFQQDTLDINDQQNSVITDLRFFFNQVFHILLLADSLGMKTEAASCICLGSDFDGLVDTIDCCESASEMNNFYKMANEHLKQFADEAGIDLAGLDDLLKRIFFKNGRDFLMKYF